MNKSTIFFLAFMVSFMTIYSVYYYSQKRKLDASVVAMAKDLPHTVLGMADQANKDKNMIYTQGVNQVLKAPGNDSSVFPAMVPDDHFVSFHSKNTRDSLEKFFEGLVSKFQNHPPIEFNSVKEGDRVLLSYFFQNVRLPEGFRVSAAPVVFHGARVKALQYHPNPKSTDTMTSFYKNEDTHEYAFKVKLNGGKEELIMYSAANDSFWKYNYQRSGSFVNNAAYKYKPAKDESVLVPELDFSIVKDYNAEDLKALPASINTYKLTEERIKLKISAPKEGGPLEASERYNTPKNISFNGNILFYIREAGHNPYCIVNVQNPEILKVIKK